MASGRANHRARTLAALGRVSRALGALAGLSCAGCLLVLGACGAKPGGDEPIKLASGTPAAALVRVEPLVDVRAFNFRLGAPVVSGIARGAGAGEGATLLGETTGEPLHGLLHDGGVIAVIGPEAALAGALARMSEQTQPQATLPGLSGVTRSRLLTGQTWSTLLEGQTLTLPGDSATGATRLLARCWPAPDVAPSPGDGPADAPGASDAAGGLRQVMVVDLVPLLARARGSEGFSLEAPSLRTPADRGLALTTYRVRVPLRAGQALLIAPAVHERGAPDLPARPADVPALGEVRRAPPPGAASPSAGAPAQRGAPGPRTQRPLLLGEALLSDATVDRTASACTVLLLTPAPLPPGAPEGAAPGYGLAR